MDLEELATYYQGVLLTTALFKERFEGWGRSGRKALQELDSFQQMARHYRKALDETVDIRRQNA